MNAVQIQLYVFSTIAGLSTFFLFFILVTAGTKPVFALISSKLKKSPLILLGRQDGAYELHSGKYRYGVVTTKRGSFLITPESAHPFHNRKIALAYEQLSNTLPKDLIKEVTTLQESGIYDYDQAEKAKEVLTKLAKQKKLKTVDATLLKSLTNVINFFKYNTNPAQLADKEASILEIEKDKDKKNYMLIGVVVVFVVLAFAVAIYVIGTFLKCPACPTWDQVHNVASTAVDTAQNAGGMVIQ
jgi:hypothetical protein